MDGRANIFVMKKYVFFFSFALYYYPNSFCQCDLFLFIFCSLTVTELIAFSINSPLNALSFNMYSRMIQFRVLLTLKSHFTLFFARLQCIFILIFSLKIVKHVQLVDNLQNSNILMLVFLPSEKLKIHNAYIRYCEHQFPILFFFLH